MTFMLSQSIKPQSCYQMSRPTDTTKVPLKVPDGPAGRQDFIVYYKLTVLVMLTTTII